MKNISVVSFDGKNIDGLWNEKVYSCKIEGRNDLIRIYVNNKEVHITQDEFNRISDNIKAALTEKAERESLYACRKIKDLIPNLTQKDRFEIAQHAIYEIVREVNSDTDEFDDIKKTLFKSLHRLNDYVK